jgi:carboxypeptidase Q
MIKKFPLLFLLIIPFAGRAQVQTEDSVEIRKIFSETLVNGKAYEWLHDLTKNIGSRLSGSPQAAKAVEWTKQKMIEAGADTVYLQEVYVPHWVRGGKEIGQIIEANGNKTNVPVCALGMSVPTKQEGILAQVIEINDFKQLKELGKEKIKGKIVFYNYPFDEKYISTFDAYGDAVQYRWAGPSEAARYGAVATICRSMTNTLDDFPHTGSMHYNDSLPKIPCAAISTNAAELLSRILKANSQTKFFLKQNCQLNSDSVKSYNVIGEIKGSRHPDEFIVVGGHLDSWDLAEGANDDGTGIVQSIEMLRTLKAAGLRPLRTIRAVAFMNEENGLKGGTKYANAAKEKNEKHIAAIESDAGGFMPEGFGLDMNDFQKRKIKNWAPLFLPYGLYDFSKDGDGADISKLENMNVPRLGLQVVSQRYFDYHHAASDTFDKVNKRELLLGAAAITAMAYLLATYGL